MIKTIYAYKIDLILPFVKRQIKESGLENVSQVVYLPIDHNPEIVDLYNLFNHHTLIFKDIQDRVLYKLNGPFSSEDIKIAHSIANKVLVSL